MQKVTINFVLLFILLAPSMIQANENEAILDMLVTAKLTGMCGMMKQMTSFQEATRMEGGDQFIIRFFRVEAARLGVTVEELLVKCKVSTSAYNKYVEMFRSD